MIEVNENCLLCWLIKRLVVIIVVVVGGGVVVIVVTDTVVDVSVL